MISKFHFIAKTCLATGVLIGTWSTPSLAQESDSAPIDEAAEAPGGSDIIVTAQRRAERWEDVPMAITAVSGQAMEDAGVQSIHDLSRIAPGVLVSFAGAYTQPSIRGVTSLTNGAGLENNIAIYIDGFYAPDMQSVNADMANIASIEVLKGPQGTLYGRNATGGAILINTLAPSRDVTVKAEASYGNYDDKSVSLYVSGPFSDSVRFGVAAYAHDTDGYIKLSDPNVIGGKTNIDAARIKQQSVRAKLEADVTENLELTLAYNYGLSSDPRGSLFTPFDHVPASHPSPPSLAVGQDLVSFNYQTESRATTNEGTARLAVDSGFGKILLYGGYARREIDQAYDFDGTYTDLGTTVQHYLYDTYQGGIDANINAIKGVDLLVGASYIDHTLRTAPGELAYASYGPRRATVVQNNIVDYGTKAWAVYFDATYHITDSLTIGGGGRYTEETRTFAFATENGAGGFRVPPFEREATWNNFTPRATLRYEIADRTNIYATYSRGFRSGAFNPNGVASAALAIPINPEKITAYELGFKTARRGFQFDVSGFYYDYTNLHVGITVPNPTCPVGTTCSVVSIIANAPKAEIYGVDGQLSIEPVDRLNLRFGGAWLHARYRDFPNATGTGLNATTNVNVPGQLQDWSDQPMARSPSFSGSVSADYSVPVGGGELRMSGNLTYASSHVLNNPSLFGPLAGARAMEQRYRQQAYALLNATLGWVAPGDHLTISLWGRNLTNKRYRAALTGAAMGDYGQLQWPRTYGIRLSYKY